jgi:general secretion pathway protein A
LKPLDLTETGAYIRHQLAVNNYHGTGLFSDGFVAKAFDYTKGIPRQINLVCTHALMAGYADQKQVLDETVLRQETMKKSTTQSSIRARPGTLDRRSTFVQFPTSPA